MRTLTALGALLAFACSTLTPQEPVADRPASRAAVQEPPLRVHVDAKSATVESGATLLEIVNTLGPVSKRTISIGAEVRPKLQSAFVTLSEPLRVPVDRAGDLCDSLLFAENIVLLPPVKEDLSWRVADVKGPGRLAIRETARIIQPEEIESYATKMLCVSVCLPVKYVNAREVAAAMRPFFPDNNLDTLTNIGSSDQVFLTGFGPSVAYMARVIRSIDKPESEEVQAQRKVSMVQNTNLTKRVEALEKQVELLNKALLKKPPEAK